MDEPALASSPPARAVAMRGAAAPAPRLHALRAYQVEAARAVLRSVHERAGRTITIEIARQGGKNELSAQIETFLLALAAPRHRQAVKCAPTRNPQLFISMRRLHMMLARAGLAPIVQAEPNAIRVGSSRIHFLSAERDANVVGHTANLLLEVDEAQDVDPEKFEREFVPMGATANVTTVMYGTAWDGSTLLERARQANLEAERRDGVRRHFEYDWQHVARFNPAYRAYVEEQRQKLGDTHPVFLTQYCLKPIAGAGRLFSNVQQALIQGSHARQAAPVRGEDYVAGLDPGGGAADPERAASHDATVLTLGRLVYPDLAAPVQEPRVEIVEHYAWTGVQHDALLPQIVDLLRRWDARRIAIDATGLGQTASRIIAAALGESRIDALTFSAPSKSDLGFELLAAVNGARLKMYAADGSGECAEFWRQVSLARVAYRANRTMNFFCDASEGHDDYLVSAALLVRAAKTQRRRAAVGRVRGGAADG